MIRPRKLALERTCGDRTCGVCSSRYYLCLVQPSVHGDSAWRCREWGRRPLKVVPPGGIGEDCERLPECMAAEKEAR